MNSTAQFIPNVSVVTSHGRQELSGSQNERLIDLLARYGVPWSAISAYLVPRAGGDPQLQPCLDRTLGELNEFSDVLVYFNRNVNPFIFSIAGFSTIPSATPEQGTEYLYQRLDNAKGTADTFLKRLDPGECKAVIAERVAEAVRQTVPKGSKLVVGVSGGGDSNALLDGLSRIDDHDLELHPVIIMGIPDWDAGVPRAIELCRSYELDLTVLQEEEVKALLRLPADSLSLIDRFEREFKGDDFEFLGTLLIRLALSKRAKALGTPYICTGLNLEDVLCEGMFRLATGLKPAPIPKRTIGDTELIFPLWLCPKRIIDGCFPKYSLDNYNARYPCASLGRNLYYSLIYAMQSQFPGFVEQFAHGLSELSQSEPVVEYSLDEQLGFHVERAIPFPVRHKFERMIAGATS
jgi:tRNA(Ile)-lysidine synthase TilS/MesJ